MCVPRAMPVRATAIQATPRTASTRGGSPRIKKITPSRAHAVGSTPEGAPWSTIIGHAALEGAVAVGWMTAALLSFNRLASRGRIDGSLDYGA